MRTDCDSKATISNVIVALFSFSADDIILRRKEVGRKCLRCPNDWCEGTDAGVNRLFQGYPRDGGDQGGLGRAGHVCHGSRCGLCEL